MLRRNLQLFLVGALVLVLAASLLYSLTKLRRLEEVASREIKISMWVASQPLVELLKLRNVIAGYQAGGSENGTYTAAEVEQQFDAVKSRIPLLTEGRQSRILGEISDVESVARSLAAVLEQVEPTIRSIDQADALSLRLLQARLASLEPILNGLHLDAYLQTSAQNDLRTSELHGIRTHIVITLLGTLLAAAVLVVLLVRQWRRASRLLDDARRTAEALNLSQRAVEATSNGILVTDHRNDDHPIAYCNPAFERMTGYRREEIIGRNPRFLQGGDTEQDELGKLRAAIGAGGDYRGVLKNYRKDGTLFWNQLRMSPVFDESGNLTHYVGIQTDITESHNLTQQLSYQATHDSLTGLVNRAEFERYLQRALRRAHTDGSEHALCYLDLDQFKVINDSSGHIAGDELLKQLAEVLKAKVRKSDLLARLGGDEFAVLVEHCTLADAQRVADVLRKAICEYRFQWDGKSYAVGVSAGLVPITPLTVSMTEVLKAADAACYAAKDAGRNRIHIYREGDAELSRRYGEMRWVSRINEALEKERFALRYQPIVPLSSQATPYWHFEFLLSMRDRDGALISPGAFLPAAERYGLSVKIDRWVVANALSWLSTHPEELAQTGLCSINLSGPSISDRSFLGFVVDQFEATQVPPEKLCFEITETAAITNLSSAARLISSLREIGCSFALDDFGSGVSSFAYLKNLAVDLIKIDGVFVKDICSDPVSRALVKSINDMGHAMGKRTIAEAVEDQAVFEELRRIGVDFAQGYGITAPRPLTTLEVAPQSRTLTAQRA
ncbi:MAG: EAL domain-containing protein [Gammaproteobacteria bacterium]|nr:EAL domain-containing protein [Gammaproteobacteria bacterium]NIN37231.1 EAL domain-containing protein [Gammaproteobacteria bacterium]NIO26089.1 EAL domain-containing protein [Gammaproteobacteria bacterium]NIO66702.1 EAL domain-containing protein [Gammaproteobacteria bacterium]NIP46379.1 EAL domain-containing protein [Gammaproteobacteria bacterium]